MGSVKNRTNWCWSAEVCSQIKWWCKKIFKCFVLWMNNSFDSILQWKFYQFQPETTIKWAHHTNILTGYYLKTKKKQQKKTAMKWPDGLTRWSAVHSLHSWFHQRTSKKAKKNLHQVNNFQVTYIYLCLWGRYEKKIWLKNIKRLNEPILLIHIF